MIRFLIGCAAVTAVTIGTMATANAQGWGGHGYASSGHSYNRYAAGCGQNSGYGYGGDHHGGSFSGYPHGYGIQGRTHLDYHPASIQRHYGHFDYVPSHYDVHRSGYGHW